ncbi:MAG TPA: hypothetical protein VF371_00825 [Candidatus Limnocylindrales bacterium]|jgi:hypothetical protein
MNGTGAWRPRKPQAQPEPRQPLFDVRQAVILAIAIAVALLVGVAQGLAPGLVAGGGAPAVLPQLVGK